MKKNTSRRNVLKTISTVSALSIGGISTVNATSKTHGALKTTLSTLFVDGVIAQFLLKNFAKA